MTFHTPIYKNYGLISKAVGNNLENQEQDVRIIRTTFKDLSITDNKDYEIEENGEPLGIFTRPLHNKIREYQHDNKLYVDGLIKPGGETEISLIKKKTETTNSIQKTNR